jgi:hypothetical protein
VHWILLVRLVDEGHALLLAVEKFLCQLAVGEGSAAVGSCSKMVFPWLGASAKRTVRGMTDL